jgi:hypothetical protein
LTRSEARPTIAYEVVVSKGKTQAKPAKPVAAPPAEAESRRAADLFVRGVLTRGEAARAERGALPPGATHEIVEEKEGELPKIARKRFSAF